MLYLLAVFVLVFGCFLFYERDNFLEAFDILGMILFSAMVAIILWLVALVFVLGFATPSTQIIDSTATLLPVNLNDGKVALGYEIEPINTEGEWYVYEDEQDEDTKYLFIEHTDDPTDFGIHVKLIDADKCKIRYIDDEDPCKVEYYHTEYTGFARAIIKNGNNGITLYIHKNSMEKIWFPYSN